MDQNPYATSSTPVIPQNGADIDSLDVSDRWKQFFKGVQKWGGLQMPLYKALPKGPQRREALKDVKPPIASFALAFRRLLEPFCLRDKLRESLRKRSSSAL